MEQKDLEKIVKIILDNPDKEEATRLIIELIKAVEKPPEVRIVHDYTYPLPPNYINDSNKLTWPGWEPFRYEPTCQSGTAKDTHWEQPCSTTTATNDTNLSGNLEWAKEDYLNPRKPKDNDNHKRGFA